MSRPASSNVDDSIGVVITASYKLILILLLVLLALYHAKHLIIVRTGAVEVCILSHWLLLPFGSVPVVLRLRAKRRLLVRVNLIGSIGELKNLSPSLLLRLRLHFLGGSS